MFFGFKAAERAPIQDSRVINPGECPEKTIFANLSCEFGKMLHVYSPHGLIQAIGYLKYKAAKQRKPFGILYRGQSSLYPSLIPSLYRNISATHPKKYYDLDFQEKISDAKKEIFKKAEEYKKTKSTTMDDRVYDDLYQFVDVTEELFPPLLQHYGLATPWIDVVDNIWVALWFACHKRLKPHVVLPEVEHIHYRMLHLLLPVWCSGMLVPHTTLVKRGAIYSHILSHRPRIA